MRIWRRIKLNSAKSFCKINLMQALKETELQHPAAEWAENTSFSTLDVDCTITVVLKILDNKCKMLPGEKNAIFEIYDVIKDQPGELFIQKDYDVIENARHDETATEMVMLKIHQLRVYAEDQIPKPVMKKYKAMLRNGLFGE